MGISYLPNLTSALIKLFVAVATSAVVQAEALERPAAELPFARSRDEIREVYIISFGAAEDKSADI